MIAIAVAFPKHDADRQRYRDLLPTTPLPAIYEDGEDRPCEKCQVILNVGPRLTTLKPLAVYCLFCAIELFGPDAVGNPIHLGGPANPEKR